MFIKLQARWRVRGARAVFKSPGLLREKRMTLLKARRKTADGMGTRPIFTILKRNATELLRKNNLGTGQRAEYMKTIFGEEGKLSCCCINDCGVLKR